MTIDLSRVAIIARKEFADHLTSRTFLLVLALFGILTVLSLETTLTSYASMMRSYEFLLERALERAAHADPSPLFPLPTPPPPLAGLIFQRIGDTFGIFGPLIAIAVGFNLIAGEREEDTLKVLLSRPVYRDEVITGKTLGGVAVLAFASAAVFAVALGGVLVAGLTVTPHDAVIVVRCWGATLLFLLAYFGVAVAFSAFSEDSGRALAWAMVVFILFSTVVPVVAVDVARTVAGPAPPWPGADAPPDEVQRYQEEMHVHAATYGGVQNMMLALSPEGNFGVMRGALTGEDLAASLGGVWQNLIGLLAFPAIFLAVAYVRFMRIDLR